MATAHLLRPPCPLPAAAPLRRHGRHLIRAAAGTSPDPGGDFSSSSSSSSYLDMWRKAMERERRGREFKWISENASPDAGVEEGTEAVERRTRDFEKLLDVPPEERDRVQRLQVIDRAAAAIAATRALLKDLPKGDGRRGEVLDGGDVADGLAEGSLGRAGDAAVDASNGKFSVPSSKSPSLVAPGPDFWSWSPPLEAQPKATTGSLAPAVKAAPASTPLNPVIEKEPSMDYLVIPFERTFSEPKSPHFPPLQSLMNVAQVNAAIPISEPAVLTPKDELDVVFSTHAEEATEALHGDPENVLEGVYPDGSRWWRETGIESRENGVVCRWTLNRGVSKNGEVEWQEKFWEAADDFDYKELGSEKSGRDAAGNVWREYWKECMWQDATSGLLHIEKTADKWGKNGKGDEWREEWFEHYDATGQADKWAHKWCTIDPNTTLEAGHAHVWHERWGEKYDGVGGSNKYTDKWAERLEGDVWVKWGDKWDEDFNRHQHGLKQGESWWQGKQGEKWNRTWGEGHNGSGWIHKYGKSSSGEHWDTHTQQETWYERHPHYGFELCFKNSVQLRDVIKPPETT